MAEMDDISWEMRSRRWHWLGRAFRTESVNNCFKVLGWTPAKGKREAKDHVKKDIGKGEKPGGVEELEHGADQEGGTE